MPTQNNSINKYKVSWTLAIPNWQIPAATDFAVNVCGYTPCKPEIVGNKRPDLSDDRLVYLTFIKGPFGDWVIYRKSIKAQTRISFNSLNNFISAHMRRSNGYK